MLTLRQMAKYIHLKLNDLYMLKFTFIPVLVVLTTACTTKLSDVDYLNRTTEIYTMHFSSYDGWPCDDDGVDILMLFPRQNRYIYRGDISIMQEGAYTERNDSLFLMPSMAMKAESYKHYDYYKQYVYPEINDSTQSNVVTRPKLFIRLNNVSIAEVLRHFDFKKSYYRNGVEYYAITGTIGNLDFHEFPQDVRDSIMATMTETHIIYQRVKLSK